MSVLRFLAPLIVMLALSDCGSDGHGDGGASVPPVASYGLSGTLAHLDSGTLSVSNGSETVSIAQGASTFAFTKPLANGSAYSVTVTAQPAGATCAVENASGTVNDVAITNVAIRCNTLVSQSLAIGVSASGSLNSNSSRIFLPVTLVGTATTTINAILDTGSAGALLRASDVFPVSMVTTDGFVFPSGQTSLSYNDITVTNIVATRVYGAQSDLVTKQTGNLGFAQITFGNGTRATTATVPILFVFKTEVNGAAVATTNFANLIGVNAAIAPVDVTGTPDPTTPTPCTPQSTTSCGLASPFRYFSYADGTDKGFVLSKVTFAACDITIAGACPVTPSLVLGTTASIVEGFSVTSLSSCNSVVLIGTTAEPLCSQVIPSVTVASGNASFTGPAIFDSGAPMTRLSVLPGTSFPDTLAEGSTVSIATSAGFSYSYVTATGYLKTSVAKPAEVGTTNTGVGFFAQNSLLIDYSKALEGWRNG